MTNATPSRRVRVYLGALLAAAGLLAPAGRARAQAVIKVNDTTFFKIGVLLQSWADWQEQTDASGTTSTGYQQNLFIRRVRLLMGGQVVENVSFLFQTDNSNLGKNKASSTALSASPAVLDAFIMWKIAREFQIQAGLALVPLSRSTLVQSFNVLTLDSAPTSFIASTATQGNSGRDTGFGLMGFLLEDRLQYRTGVYSGERLPGARNSFRYAGRLQYEVFDTETGYLDWGYTYKGTNLGEKKILAIGAGSDNQGNYHAYTADVFADIPLGKGDAATGSLNWLHYDGEDRFASLPRQNDYLIEAGYYFSPVKLQPFFQYHRQDFSDAAAVAGNSRRYQGGFHYYVHGFNFNVTGAFTRLIPKASAKLPTNEFTVQFQVWYF